ncbi:hypothetical protein E3U43_018926 [Larimichthys crocea]|uniref:Uncharacterized protein n=1 Tax=Larimichthys crocea TaxID=215358 RepID=A0ACD3QWL5_LARCR|nr:hypothetical protein E3U43_018926 [Larimichthys crocea]
MENEDSLEESGELTYRKLDVPIITSEALEPVVTLFLSAITDDQWVLLAADQIDFETFTLLYDMCHEVTNVITTWILDVVEPQIKNWISTATAQDRNMRHHDYYSLTEDNVKASIGNSFDCCFGEVTGIPQERSNESVILLEMIASEVKKRVNESLAGLISSAGQSASCPQIESTESNESHDSDTTQMVYQAGSILKFLLKKDTESSKDQENPCAVTSEDCCPSKVANIEHSSPHDLDPKEPGPEDTKMCPVPKMQSSGHQVLCPAKGTEKGSMEDEKYMEDVSLEEFRPTSPKSTGSFQQVSLASSDTASEGGGTSPTQEQRLKKSGKNWSFGHKLRTFFNRNTNKVTPACDLNTSESHSWAEDATIMCPVPNMQRSDSEETVTNSSSEQLNNSSPKNRSFGHKLRTFFNSKTNKVTPGSDLNTSEGQGSLCRVSRNSLCADEITEVEESCSEDPLTPLCENRSMQSSKQPAIMRILSSTGRILMKPFTCCWC